MTRNIIIAAVIAGAAAAATWLLAGSADDTGGAAPLVYAWPDDQRLVYHLSYDGRHAVSLPADGNTVVGGLDVHTVIEGELSIQRHAVPGDDVVLGWRLDGLEQFDVTMQGSPVTSIAEARAAFAGREVFVDVSPTGAVRGLRFDDDTPELVRATMKMLAAELQVQVPGRPTRTWSAVESSPHGRAETAYAQLSGGRLRKTRPHGYGALRSLPWLNPQHAAQTVDYAANAHLDPTGRLVSLAVRERTTVNAGKTTALDVDTTAILTLRGTASATVARMSDLATAVAVGIDSIDVSLQAERNALLGRANGLTWDDVDRGVRGFSGPSETFSRWLWRTTGLLKLEPELCDSFVPLFDEAGFDETRRGLILDILVSTGHAHAQQVVRQLIASPTARANLRSYVAYIGRLSLLDAPDADSARFALALYDGSEGHAKTAAAYAMGSIVSKLPPGDDELRAELNQRLIDDLIAEPSAQERAGLLVALGNAGQAENLPVIREAATSPASAVRAAAASALRKTPGPQTATVLVGLAADRNHEVQRAALRVLDGHPLSASAQQALGARVLSGVLSPENYGVALRIVTRFDDRALVRAVAQYMLAQSPPDAQLRGRLRAALQDGGA